MTLSKLKFDFITKAREYNRCKIAKGRRDIVEGIDGILDRHTQLEVAIGMAAIEESLDIRYEPVSSAARQAYIDGVPEAELREIDAEQAGL